MPEVATQAAVLQINTGFQTVIYEVQIRLLKKTIDALQRFSMGSGEWSVGIVDHCTAVGSLILGAKYDRLRLFDISANVFRRHPELSDESGKHGPWGDVRRLTPEYGRSGKIEQVEVAKQIEERPDRLASHRRVVVTRSAACGVACKDCEPPRRWWKHDGQGEIGNDNSDPTFVVRLVPWFARAGAHFMPPDKVEYMIGQ
jgi:hypothetical protein